MIPIKFIFSKSPNVFTRQLSQIKQLVVHHSGSQIDSIKSINEYHNTKFDQGGITYHFVIDRDGALYQTRPLDHVTSHVKNANTKSIGVCFLGDFENNNVPYDVRIPFAQLLNFLSLKLNNFDVVFHSDVVTTVCPGRFLKSNLDIYVSNQQNN